MTQPNINLGDVFDSVMSTVVPWALFGIASAMVAVAGLGGAVVGFMLGLFGLDVSIPVFAGIGAGTGLCILGFGVIATRTNWLKI